MSEALPLGIDFDSILAPVKSGTKRNQKIEGEIQEKNLRQLQQLSRELDGHPKMAENIALASALVQQAREPLTSENQFIRILEWLYKTIPLINGCNLYSSARCLKIQI